VARLRSAIGHEPLWLPAVAMVVTNERDQVLLGLRSDLKVWALIAGILDPQEEPLRGALRELSEEAGIEAEPVAIVEVESSDAVTYPNGDVSAYLSVLFWLRHTGGVAHVADDESLDMGWFDLDDLPEPLAVSTRKRLAAFARFRRRGDSRTLFEGIAENPF
jgi:8-oxo-dGTP pyrophosphatase MutT (NUDIX family)